MKKLCVTLSMIVLLTLSGCDSKVLRPITTFIDNFAWPAFGARLDDYANSLKSRVTKISEAFPDEAREDVQDIAEQVLCSYLDELKSKDLPSSDSVSLTTTVRASGKGYSAVNPLLPDQIYAALKDISVGGVTAIDGLQLYCAIK